MYVCIVWLVFLFCLNSSSQSSLQLPNQHHLHHHHHLQAIIARLLALPANQRSEGDLFHVYDALVQNATDIIKLPGVEDLEEILTCAMVSHLVAFVSIPFCKHLITPTTCLSLYTQAAQARYRAHRAFHLAECHATIKPTPSLAEALVLYEFASNLASQALELTEDLKQSKEKAAAVADLEKLRSLATGESRSSVCIQ